MKVHRFSTRPPPCLTEKLSSFERQFRYPLGTQESFRISHGEDYTRFYRAVGDAACFAAERRGEVVGVLSTAARQLMSPCGELQKITYIGDLKIAPGTIRGMVLFRLMAAAWEHHRARAGHPAGFGVVMDGTRVEPDRYTGRLGMPKFTELGKIMILRLPINQSIHRHAGVRIEPCTETDERHFRGLSAGCYRTLGTRPRLRSRFGPIALGLNDPPACGLLEDTLDAKQLISADETEMLSSHLSSFAYSTPAAGARIVRTALSLTRERGLPALFVAVPMGDHEHLVDELQIEGITLAPATVFGTGLEPGFPWIINTSEI